MDGNLDGIIGLAAIVLGSSGFVYYRLGKLTEKVKGQSKDIQELKELVKNNNKPKAKRRARK